MKEPVVLTGELSLEMLNVTGYDFKIPYSNPNHRTQTGFQSFMTVAFC